MRIIEETTAVDSKYIEITRADYEGDFSIKIKFKDFSEKTVDFKPFIFNSLNPVVRKYKEENLFKSFKIIDGNLNWNDYDLIFPLGDLYEGHI